MPNGEDKKLNFTLKVWDSSTNSYKPVYIAPDATDTVQGDVKLSDATNSTLDAVNGMTAATPKAVKAVQDNANNKLDKTSSSAQTVASDVTFSGALTVNRGVTVPSGQFFNGDLEGNATTATTLETSRQISVKVGSATAGTANFNGGANASIIIPQVDASTVTLGTLPLSVIPKGAMERLVKVANETARFALTEDDVQLGDSVLQMDTDVMYVVIDTSNLNNASGYEEYAAGTSLVAETAEKVRNALTVQKGGSTQFTFDGSVARTINFASEFADLTGQIAAAQIPNGIITADKLGVNYAGSSSKGGAATSAEKLQTARDISFTGVVQGTGSFDGSADISITTSIPDGSISSTMIADNAVTSDKISDNSITSNKIVDGTITGVDIAEATITGDNIEDASIDGSKLVSNSITSTQIQDETIIGDKIASNTITGDNLAEGAVAEVNLASDSVSLTKLASDVGTVAVQNAEPTDDNVKIWIQI